MRTDALDDALKDLLIQHGGSTPVHSRAVEELDLLKSTLDDLIQLLIHARAYTQDNKNLYLEITATLNTEKGRERKNF